MAGPPPCLPACLQNLLLSVPFCWLLSLSWLFVPQEVCLVSKASEIDPAGPNSARPPVPARGEDAGTALCLCLCLKRLPAFHCSLRREEGEMSLYDGVLSL